MKQVFIFIMKYFLSNGNSLIPLKLIKENFSALEEWLKLWCLSKLDRTEIIIFSSENKFKYGVIIIKPI